MIPVIGILAAIMLPALARAREAARRQTCANNLKQMGLVYKMFANVSQEEVYPELSNEPGRLMFTLNESSGSKSVYPEYLADLQVMICPSDADAYPAEESGASLDPEWVLDDNSYFYLGYVVTNDAEMAAFAQAYRTRVAEGGAFLDDLSVPEGTGAAGGNKILRLREEVLQFYLTTLDGPSATIPRPGQSDIPLMIERPENHVPGGGNVLFMDGHVQFMKYPGDWPMTEETIGLLESLDALGQ